MAIKTFTSGEVLTAANTNTYLTNSGLVYITEAVASGTATTLNIQSCFSGTYDNYRIVATEWRSSSNGTIWFRLLSGATPNTSAAYSYGFAGLSTLGVSTNGSNFGQTFAFLGTSNISTQLSNSFTFDITNPFLARQTYLLGTTMNLNAGLNGFDIRSGGAVMDTSSSFDGIQLGAAAGNISGRFKIYGYRQA